MTKGGEEEIDLSIFPGWDELGAAKQRFLVEFSKRNLKRSRSALAAGINPATLDKWLQEDANLRAIHDHIIDLHAEGVEEVDYIASFDPKNNTSRGRWLSKRSKVYKETSRSKEQKPPQISKQTNILAVLNSSDVTDKGLAGVQKMFNSLKEQGNLPEGMEVGQDNS